MNTQTKKIETTEKITDNIEKYRIPDAKRTALANKAAELITSSPHLSNQQIADALQISRPTLDKIVTREYTQKLLKRELAEHEATINKWINELYHTKPDNPTNKRAATKYRIDVAKNIADKIRPTRTENINVNINQDTEQLRAYKKLNQELMRRLPTKTYKLTQRILNQIRQEWGWTNNPNNNP